ncbi:MAG TPA: MBL fold metallo-hydrolase [Patescibacteria group bacterium]|nr:MBL fold metallo-hydrolase [Patescibacteria group bacterium]
MRVICLKPNDKLYSCQSYLILGDWNRLEDVNTLIDAGVDNFVLQEIARISTGVGKSAVDQILLTHSHFDHAAGSCMIQEAYRSRVRAFAPLAYVDEVLRDGETVRCGDRDFRVIHSPGHSNDSVCLYCEQERVLFSGDTPLVIRTAGGAYTLSFVQVLELLAGLKIDTVYPGHGTPMTAHIRAMILQTLKNVRSSVVCD